MYTANLHSIYIYTYVYIHAHDSRYVHTYIHTYKHTYIQTYRQTYKHADIHTCMHIRKLTQACKCGLQHLRHNRQQLCQQASVTTNTGHRSAMKHSQAWCMRIIRFVTHLYWQHMMRMLFLYMAGSTLRHSFRHSLFDIIKLKHRHPKRAQRLPEGWHALFRQYASHENHALESRL